MRRARLLAALALVPLLACARAEFRPRPVGSLYAGQADVATLMEEARFHLGAGNFALAISSFRRVLRQAPDMPDAYAGLALAYEGLGRLDLARRYYRLGIVATADRERLAEGYVALERRHPQESQAGTAPATPAASVTIELPPAPAPERVPRLERLSNTEVELVTVPAAPRPAHAAASDDRLPIRLVRNTGTELVWELEPVAQRAPDAAGPLRILNAVGRRGQAARMEQHLGATGWHQVSIGDASSRRLRSSVVSPPGQSAAARRLSGSLPFAPRVSVSPSARQLFLVLGRDAVPFDQRLAGASRGGGAGQAGRAGR